MYITAINEIAIAPTVAGYPSATGSFARVQFQNLVPGQSLFLYVSLLDATGRLIPNAAGPVIMNISGNQALKAAIPPLLSGAVILAGFVPSN